MDKIQRIAAYIRREMPRVAAQGRITSLFRPIEDGEYVPSISGPPVKVTGDFLFIPTSAPVTAAERYRILQTFAPPSVPLTPAERAKNRARRAADKGER